jgi:hypothetical protein
VVIELEIARDMTLVKQLLQIDEGTTAAVSVLFGIELAFA